MKIGIIREEKNPPDTRVPLSPLQCADLIELYPELDVVVEPSVNRCFTNEEFTKTGATLQRDLSDCDVILGVKEVPIEKLIPHKTYLFFSHTRKKQPYNKKLMQALIAKNIRLIDYECLTYKDGKRVLGFGFFAGVVGGHNGLLTYGKKFQKFQLKAAHDFSSMLQMMAQYREVHLPPVKIILTGSGRVAAGFLNIMEHWDILNVESSDFLNLDYEYPVYTHLKGFDLYENRKTKSFDRDDFHLHPKDYKCKFQPYTKVADILMNGIFWDDRIEPLFTLEDIQNKDFRIGVIADVTCDINGSVPTTIAATTIADPVYGFDRKSLRRTQPFQNTLDVIDMMTVDNLPNELPRDASRHFGEHIIKYVIPELLNEKSEMIEKATICRDGNLTPHFEYLHDYVFDK